MTLDQLRAFAVSRSLFPPLTLKRAIETLGFVQADPIRAPARAQDLTLRHRVINYRAGDLEARYARLGVEEDFFINYGFVSQRVFALMHPREKRRVAATARTRKDKLLAFVGERGEVHPREVDAHFAHGTVTNYWGGSSSATTRLLEDLQYRGWLRVARRESGIRIYALRELPPELPPKGGSHTGLQTGLVASRERRIDALVDVVVNIYAPLPAQSLSAVVARLRYAVPQWRGLVKPALVRARQRLAHAHVDGVDWYWPEGERALSADDEAVRLLAPFDPVVWDRRRFELFWGWPYRFEAYTPAAKRTYGYYALPMLWRNDVIGWANLGIVNGVLEPQFGYVKGHAPRDRTFKQELEAELARFRAFLR